jgi:hypothetical protein
MAGKKKKKTKKSTSGDVLLLPLTDVEVHKNLKVVYAKTGEKLDDESLHAHQGEDPK